MQDKVILLRITIACVVLTGVCAAVAIHFLLPGKKIALASILMYAKEDFTSIGWRFRQATVVFGNATFISMLISFMRQQ